MIPEAEICERTELAETLEVAENQVEFFVSAAKEETGKTIRVDKAEGDLIFHRGDLESAFSACKGGRPSPERMNAAWTAKREAESEHERDPLPPTVKVAGFTFSDDGGSTGRTPSADDGIRVSEAAKQAGISEDDMRERLIGKAQLRVVDGELVARRGDLLKLAEGGTIPKPTKTKATGNESVPRDHSVAERTRRAAEAIGVARPDPSDVNRRADAIAAAIGAERPSSKAGKAESEPASGAGVQRMSAEDRASTRIGAPRRWGQS